MSTLLARLAAALLALAMMAGLVPAGGGCEMPHSLKRTSLIFALAVAMTMSFASAAAAGPPQRGCGTGPVPQAAKPNDRHWDAGWRLVGIPDLAEEIRDEQDPEGTVDFWVDVLAFWDRNNDGKVCVFRYVLPNDASGHDTWFNVVDNRSNARVNGD